MLLIVVCVSDKKKKRNKTGRGAEFYRLSRLACATTPTVRRASFKSRRIPAALSTTKTPNPNGRIRLRTKFGIGIVSVESDDQCTPLCSSAFRTNTSQS